MDALPFLFVDSVLHLVDLISLYRLRDAGCLLWSDAATIHEDNRCGINLEVSLIQDSSLYLCPNMNRLLQKNKAKSANTRTVERSVVVESYSLLRHKLDKKIC
uniref:Protein kinase domain-containing protein n=1 Tax=Steinernema glaseri TaxID=37863 RepID=A0A1I7Z1G7_9BILA